MRTTETDRQRGYVEAYGRRVPIKEASPQRKRELRESLVNAFIALGHSPEAARIAAGGNTGGALLDAFAFAEAVAANPLEELGTLSAEFQATQKVLEGAGYTCASVVANTSTACFTKANCRDILLSMDGNWRFANAKDDSVRGLTDPLTRAGNDSVMNGRNANGLKLAFLTGLK